MPSRPTPHHAAGHRARTADRRASAAARGYDRHWARARTAHLTEHPLCEDCRQHGRLAPATQVHHLVRVTERPDLMYTPDNMLSLCERCHSRRTARGE